MGNKKELQAKLTVCQTTVLSNAGRLSETGGDIRHSPEGKKAMRHSVEGKKAMRHSSKGKKAIRHSPEGKKAMRHSAKGKKAIRHSAKGKKGGFTQVKPPFFLQAECLKLSTFCSSDARDMFKRTFLQAKKRLNY